MGSTFDRDLVKLLRQGGCEFTRAAKGSHDVWWSPVSQRHFTLPHGIVSRHTANAVLKDAGLKKAF